MNIAKSNQDKQRSSIGAIATCGQIYCTYKQTSYSHKKWKFGQYGSDKQGKQGKQGEQGRKKPNVYQLFPPLPLYFPCPPCLPQQINSLTEPYWKFGWFVTFEEVQ
ncbi:MAG: hypothetical protein PUP91_10870 [Rhizonema sp. PD37]|nr:hypothetical protein [Rhizonema sp. PD37]